LGALETFPRADVSVVVTRKDRRLRIIAVEDVGLGLPVGPVLIDVLHRNFNDTRAAAG
jgi:hypothetical protein